MALTMHLYRRLMRRWRVFWLVLLASVPGVVIAIAGTEVVASGRLTEAFIEIMVSVGYTYAIAALILTVSTLRDERDAGTLPYIYMKPIPRLSMGIASLLAGILAAGTIAIGGWLATVAAGLIHGASFSLVAPGAALLGAAAVGYAAIFVPIGYLFSRSVLVGLGYLVLVELVLSGLVSGIAQLSIWQIAVSIYIDLIDTTALALEGPFDAVTPGVGGGLAKLGVVLVIGLGVLTWALRRRDAL